MIVKIGDKWVVKSKDGSHQFGEYDTEEAAKKRLAEVEAFKHMNNKLQVNILYTINSSSNISEKIIDGDPHYIIKNVVPVVDDIVMNDGLYPADEIKKSFRGLDGKPAPYNHPMIDGKYVSASMTRAANQFSVGAWIENSTHDGSKALVDLYINKVVAERSDNGRELLSRIDALKNNADGAEPVQVSTGLLLNREKASGKSKGKKYSWIARNMEWDHLAILPPGVPGAGSPDDGVGIFATNGQEIERITVNLEESTMPDTSADHLNKSWLKKLVRYMVKNSDLSFDDITSQIRSILQAELGKDSWPYIVAVYDDRAGFEIDGQLYQQPYIIQEDMVKLVGERVKAVYKTELEPVKSNEGDISMTNEELQVILTNALKPVQEKLDSVNTELALVKQQNADMQKVLSANAEQEETVMRAAILKELKLPESAVNALTGDALRETYALTSKAPAIKGGMQGNSADDDFSMEAPE
nr:MAG TPA: Prohead core protein serine protease [Caudoviricetes sp.]